MITDIHTHIYNEKQYNEYFRKVKNISKILVMHWHKFNLEKFLEFTRSKDNLFAVSAIDIDKNIKKQLDINQKLFATEKIFGIKLYPGYQYFYPSDKKIYPIAKLCEKYNKPLIFHSGDVWDPKDKSLLKYSNPIHIDELAVKFPKCKIIISHFGFPYFLETANVVSKNNNVYTDISGTIDKTETEKDMKNRITQYADDLKRTLNYFPDIKNKIMFGSDFSGDDTPLNLVNPYIEITKKVFSKNEQENIFYKTAEELFFK